MKRINGNAVFIAAIISEATIIYLGLTKTVAYLWLNPIGCFLVMILGLVLNRAVGEKRVVAETT
jgi:hypothetical protein